jgi:hypothetical protein
MTLSECSLACTTVSNKFRGAHGGNRFCQTGCKWAADANFRVAPSEADSKCVKLTKCENGEYEFAQPTAFSDRVCKKHLTCERDFTIRTDDCINFVKRLNSAVLVELKAAGRSDKADHMFECYYGYSLAWPKDTCNEELKFMSKFSEFSLKFTCENKNQPVMRLKSANAEACESNIQSLVELSSVKTTTTTTTTITVSTTTTTTILCSAGQFMWENQHGNGCEACPDGQYQADDNHRHFSCNKHVVCAQDEYLAVEGTSTTPNTCTSHTECGDGEFESTAPTAGSSDRECTVRIFRQKFALEDAFGSHACSLEANMRVTNDIPLGSPLPLTVAIINYAGTLKARQ